MLILVFRKKNSGVDVELGFAFSLRQATVGRPHTLEECISGHCFLKKRNNVKAFLLINTKYMNACKTKRRIKQRYLDKRAKYSAILPRWVLDSVRRTKRV